MTKIGDFKFNDRAHVRVGSDSYPVTVVRVSKGGHAVWVRHDKFVAGPGHDYYGIQNWKINSDFAGRVERFNWRPSYKAYCGSGVLVHGWYAYQDPSF